MPFRGDSSVFGIRPAQDFINQKQYGLPLSGGTNQVAQTVDLR